MEHRCSEHAEVHADTFELIDGNVRGEIEAVCEVCGAELRYEYVLDKIVDEETEEAEYVHY